MEGRRSARLASCLLTLPEPYDVPVFTRVKVHRDFHVEVARALYSLPQQWIGQHLDARADSELVKLFHAGFYRAGGMVVALWERAALEVDSCVEDNGGWGGVTLAHNVATRQEVDGAIDQAERAGTTIGRRGAATSGAATRASSWTNPVAPV